MITQYHTENSVYEIDDMNKTWTRLRQGPNSGLLRSGWGPYWEVDCLGVGFPLVITGPPINLEADRRVVSTSPVTLIERMPDENQGAAHHMG